MAFSNFVIKAFLYHGRVFLSKPLSFCFKSGYIRQILVHIQIQSASDRLGFAHVLKDDFFFGEQFLEHIRDLELSSGCCPFVGMFFVVARHISIKFLTLLGGSVLGDINRVVHQTHPVISGLMFKGVTILLAVLHHEFDDCRSGIRYLDGVRLDMGNSKAPFLHLMLEVDHKQGTALGDDIVFVPIITEGVLEVGRGQTIDRVNGNLQRLSQSVRRTFVRQILSQSAIQHLAGLIEVLVLNSNTGIFDFLEPLCVFRPEQFLRDNTGGMHRCNVQQGDISIHSRLSVNITALADFFASINGFAVLELIAREDWPLFLVEGGVMVELWCKGEGRFGGEE